ncbi:MAG: phosphoribosylaminoimidazolesuccinocarboxamide synthase [Acidobacteriota bacterium]|jgi:phosphoribosylaminoimidazole-succinocarboxamide synthase|nr:phosphoribosylaminoimidazolesuccinocarboxamide synthase [Acidobacteriota bacterium]
MANEPNVCTQTELEGLKLLRRGKVRDLYEYGDKLLLIATDRISAFDVVLPTPIPYKGAVLTQLSRFWFDRFSDFVPNHLVSAEAGDFPADLQKFRDVLNLRSMLTVNAEMFPVECVARGYLAGSGWKEYQKSGTACGIRLPAGLKECDRLPEPIFTPATKADEGHDMNISFDKAADIIGVESATRLRDLTIGLYSRAAEYALERGIIIADVKFEFGVYDGKIILCDEVLTPDSSRFWPRAEYQPGKNPPSFDKQYVRDYLEEIHFNKQPPAPELPAEVVKGTMDKYLEAYRLLAGKPLV